MDSTQAVQIAKFASIVNQVEDVGLIGFTDQVDVVRMIVYVHL